MSVFIASLGAQQKLTPVTLSGIEVENTHLPKESVIRLLGLKVGQKVDNDTLLAACERVSKTGLVADINYSFRQEQDKSSATVIFKLWDELPLLPATVFPKENDSAAWSCLQSADGIFMRDLPNTRNALQFYVANLDRCISQTSNEPLHVVAKVLCDANQKPASIEFRIEPDANGTK